MLFLSIPSTLFSPLIGVISEDIEPTTIHNTLAITFYITSSSYIFIFSYGIVKNYSKLSIRDKKIVPYLKYLAYLSLFVFVCGFTSVALFGSGGTTPYFE